MLFFQPLIKVNYLKSECSFVFLNLCFLTDFVYCLHHVLTILYSLINVMLDCCFDLCSCRWGREMKGSSNTMSSGMIRLLRILFVFYFFATSLQRSCHPSTLSSLKWSNFLKEKRSEGDLLLNEKRSETF